MKNDHKISVLILGGTGAMGKHLVSILNEKGDFDVYVTSRQKHDSYENVTFIQGGAKDLEFIIPLAQQKKWDCIVDFMVYATTEEFEEHAKWLLDNTKQYVYISSSRVYADSETPITEETSRLLDVIADEQFLKMNTYALEKARDENILLKRGKKNWTIIRPYITYSEERLQLGMVEKEDWLYRALHGRPIIFSKDIAKCQTTVTYGYDVSRGIASIIGKEDAIGEIFHITSSESHTWQEILNVYVSTIYKKTGKKTQVKFTEKWESWEGGYPEKWKYDRLYNRTFDNSKIGKFVDVATFVPTLEGLEKCLEYFIDHQNFKNVIWNNEIEKDIYSRWLTWPSYYPTLKLRVKYLLYYFGLKSIIRPICTQMKKIFR